jgi:RimJ/RimL family protein N-acetyltransferase
MLHMIHLAFGRYGLPRVRISVYNRNTEALRLYLKLGFRPYAARGETDFRGDPVVLIHLSLKKKAFQGLPSAGG